MFESTDSNSASSTDDDKTREQQMQREIDKAQSALDTAAMLAPNDPEVQRLQNELRGADPKNIDAQKLERIVREAQDKAAEETQQTLMGGFAALAGLGLAGLGAKLLSNGVGNPTEFHEAQTGAGAPGYPALQNNFGSLPMLEKQLNQISLPGQ
jgi:hypothetical protein